MSESPWLPALVAGLAALAVGAAGGILTTIGPWYRALRNPAWKPPDWAFGPVWATIFTLCVVSASLAWNAADHAARSALVATYGVNAALNIAWSALFFRAERPDWAFVELVFLWFSVSALIGVTLPASGLAAVLLTPYLVWVTIAGLLNRSIVRLNGPFGSA
ncbi:TspO/MBR family protein [uncultured Methylobacterium sp.]|uniref:TspO/MBR family protein n=1 Tax=uncultured Methylobacterium sp. TaxID=157278 RepID=UPI0035CA33C7